MKRRLFTDHELVEELRREIRMRERLYDPNNMKQQRQLEKMREILAIFSCLKAFTAQATPPPPGLFDTPGDEAPHPDQM